MIQFSSGRRKIPVAPGLRIPEAGGRHLSQKVLLRYFDAIAASRVGKLAGPGARAAFLTLISGSV